MSQTGNPRATLEARVAHLKLDDLINRSQAELEALFQLAATPSVRELSGPADGRVLAGRVPLLLTRRDGLYLLNLSWLPWKGKVFEPGGDEQGWGYNRIGVGPLETRLFRFATAIESPLLGETDVFSLNYDIPGNPWPIRAVRDDLKRLREGLYLGASYVRWQGQQVFGLFFGLELMTR